MKSVWEKISADVKLPSLPDVYMRLRGVINSPDYAITDVADVVGSDPAMTAQLLKIVNSAYFGLATEISTVDRAVNLLGMQEVHDLVLAVSVTQSFAGMSNDIVDMQRFWERSVTCAVAGKELASACNVLDGERLFVAGLLHDIGHLFLYRYAPQKATQAVELAQAQLAPLYKAERAVIGTDYAHIGAELMRQWQLPQTLWELTEFHVEPAKSNEFALSTCIVHIAAILADAVDQDIDVEAALNYVSTRAWQITGLTPSQCVEIASRIGGQVSSVTQMIIPSAKAA